MGRWFASGNVPIRTVRNISPQRRDMATAPTLNSHSAHGWFWLTTYDALAQNLTRQTSRTAVAWRAAGTSL